ncbi:probable acyl-CoA dehydrogenase 6 isoform X2 [Homarus americanus]|nr:probable acyl-CoA dehydrogenase 6 isoform X2 [Homarus americanus]XP_042234234.1 probable acyl-CoA dehydrogenase 6 isoform X2 [Homarus americanus]XP_042234235.1 probable acyl-CoA dehydrogenase 6 isoform X2 [Homarus americanus]XP_042234236.1 probable acyl-CoA dehydrogenase 6 isoform X2 [Homarus americanus]
MWATPRMKYLSRSFGTLCRVNVQCRSLVTTTNSAQVIEQHQFYNEEQQKLQNAIKKLIDKEINPHVDEWETAGMWPAHKIMKLFGQAGFLGINKPVEYGGLDLDYKYQAAFNEALGGICAPGVGMGIGVQTDLTTPALARFGSEYLKREFLAPSISGDVVSCLGVSEPDAGSDVAGLQTSARHHGEDLIINGQKMWITNSWQADWICLLLNTSAGPPHLNKSLVCVPMKTPGIHLTKMIDKLGMRSSDTGQIFFDEVRVPAKNIIGEEGKGFTYQMLQFQGERMAMALSGLEPMKMCIQETLDYIRERKAFGQPLLNNQYLHFRLAELETELECLRSIIYRAVELYVHGEDITRLASMCKLKVGRLTREVADSCLQMWGGMGFTNEILVSRLCRDLRLFSIGGGADEVMLTIICKFMGTLPVPPKKNKKFIT